MRRLVALSLSLSLPFLRGTALTRCNRSRCSYVPRFFEPEPEDVSTWDGRPVLSEAGRAALERDFQADYSGGGSA